jgi:hypothetical protein
MHRHQAEVKAAEARAEIARDEEQMALLALEDEDMMG